MAWSEPALVRLVVIVLELLSVGSLHVVLEERRTKGAGAGAGPSCSGVLRLIYNECGVRYAAC